MSELEEQFLRARREAFGIVVGQLGITLLISVAGLLLGGPRTGVSALMGGGIGTLASLCMVLNVFRVDINVEPKRTLSRVYRGEFYKLMITAGLIGLVLVSVDVSFGPMLGCFAASLVVYWVALLRSSSLISVKREQQVSKG